MSKTSWFSKLTTTLQKPGDSVDEFHIRLRILVTRAFGHCGMEASEMDNYVRDLLRTNTLPEISAKLKISTNSTLQDTLYSAAIYEQAMTNTGQEPSKEESKPGEKKENIQNQFKQLNEKMTALQKSISAIHKIDNKQQSGIGSENTAVLNQLSAVLASFNGSNNKITENSSKRYEANTRKPFVCLHCNKTGHSYKFCFSASEKDKAGIKEQQKLKWEALNSRGAATNSQ